MLDEKDLQAIAQMMDKMMDEKISASERRMQVLMENIFTPQFNVLAEGQQMIREKMASKEDLLDHREEMQAELLLLKLAVKRNTQEIEKLKKAQ